MKNCLLKIKKNRKCGNQNQTRVQIFTDLGVAWGCRGLCAMSRCGRLRAPIRARGGCGGQAVGQAVGQLEVVLEEEAQSLPQSRCRSSPLPSPGSGRSGRSGWRRRAEAVGTGPSPSDRGVAPPADHDHTVNLPPLPAAPTTQPHGLTWLGPYPWNELAAPVWSGTSWWCPGVWKACRGGGW